MVSVCTIHVLVRKHSRDLVGYKERWWFFFVWCNLFILISCALLYFSYTSFFHHHHPHPNIIMVLLYYVWSTKMLTYVSLKKWMINTSRAQLIYVLQKAQSTLFFHANTQNSYYKYIMYVCTHVSKYKHS